MTTLTLVTDNTHDEFSEAVARLLPPVPAPDPPKRRASPSHPAFGSWTTRLSVVLDDQHE